MTETEALQLLDRATSTLQTDRGTHTAIIESLQTLNKALLDKDKLTIEVALLNKQIEALKAGVTPQAESAIPFTA